MLNLKDVFFFVQVADHKGFSAAAETLGIHKSTLSLRVKELESDLGVRLINRSSRQFLLTDVGAEFYAHSAELLSKANTAKEAMRQRLAEPSGLVRVTSPMEISQYLLRAILPVFLERFPKISIQENATDKFVDIIKDGFDLAIRGHSTRLVDSDLVQRSLASAPWYLFASPKYLKKMPPLEQPEQLEAYEIISIARKRSAPWQLIGPAGKTIAVPVHSRYQSNNLISLKEAACADLGIAALPHYMCRTEVKSGQLVQILPEWMASDAQLTALVPSRAGMLPAVRALVDFLGEELPKLTLATGSDATADFD